MTPMMNIVVIGCGAVFELCHRSCLQNLERTLGLRVAGLVDPNQDRLELAKGWFPTAACFTDVEACFQELRDVLLTVITTPPPLHAAHAAVGLQHGTHILCEKPLAGSLPDAESMVQLARRHDRLLALGMTRRFFPCFVEARRRIQSGEFGKRLRFTYREGEVFTWPVASAAAFRRASSGGGILLDKGVHVLDCLLYLFGQGTVKKNYDDGLREVVEGNSVTDLEFEWAQGSMQLSWETNLNSGLHVVGEKGELWIPAGPLNLFFSRAKPEAPWQEETIRVEWPLDLAPAPHRKRSPRDYNECFVFQMVQTLRAIKLKEMPAATGEDGVETLRLITDAYAMSLPLEKPWLSMVEQSFIRSNHWRKAARV